jgi:hypothetical protein
VTGIELWDHGDQLAQSLGRVKVLVCESCDDWPLELGRAVISDGAAEVFLSHRPIAPMPYLLYLHELGHLAIQRGARGFRVFGQRPRLRDEAMAWRWALKHAAITPSPEEWAGIFERLQSYGNDRRYKRDHVFDRLLAEAERNVHVQQ